MPRRDGTGPMGYGAMSGKGLGICTGARATGFGTGLRLGVGRAQGKAQGSNCRRRWGKNFIVDSTGSNTQKERLERQKELLENRLAVINQQIINK